MLKVKNIPGSGGITPFELSSGERFFYCTNGEVSTLADWKTISATDPIEYMQMGYTNLYLFERLIFWDQAKNLYRTYPETNENPDEGKYGVFNNRSLIVPAPDYAFSFPTPAEAKEFMKSPPNADPNLIYVVARLIEEIYWHQDIFEKNYPGSIGVAQPVITTF